MATTTRKSTTKTTITANTSSAEIDAEGKSSITTPSSKSAGRCAATPPAESDRSTRLSASPGFISRLHEKNELVLLNDRLAVYIDRVRQLEQENSRLSRTVESQESTVRKETSNIRSLYEDELAATRKLLDEVSNDKAKLQVEVGKLKSEIGDLHEKLHDKEKESADSTLRCRLAESRLNELQLKLNESDIKRALVDDQYKKLKIECDDLTNILTVAKKQLEEEMLARVELENRYQSLTEELAFLKQIHKEELNEYISQSRVVVEEADDRLKSEYDSQLVTALGQMRNDMEEQLHFMREEMEAVIEKRVADLQSIPAVYDSSELHTTRKHLDELNSELSRLSAENNIYKARIHSLEDELRKEQESHQMDLDTLKAELLCLHNKLDDQLREFRDLMDVKIRLDAEISAYRKLLETEETRMNLSQGSSSCYTSPKEGKKRKLEKEAGTFSTGQQVLGTSSSRLDLSRTSSTSGIVKIDSSSPDGRFIKLFNTSCDKNVSLSGWQLRQTVNDNETTYKFPRTFELKVQQYVTVWSAMSGHTHSPPSDILMKNQNWLPSDEMVAVLLDQKGQKMASLSIVGSTPSCLECSTSEKQEQVEQSKRSVSKWRWSIFSLLK